MLNTINPFKHLNSLTFGEKTITIKKSSDEEINLRKSEFVQNSENGLKNNKKGLEVSSFESEEGYNLKLSCNNGVIGNMLNVEDNVVDSITTKYGQLARAYCISAGDFSVKSRLNEVQAGVFNSEVCKFSKNI